MTHPQIIKHTTVTVQTQYWTEEIEKTRIEDSEIHPYKWGLMCKGGTTHPCGKNK